MGFEPKHNLWASEEFDDPNSITTTNPELQGVVNGYVVLKPQRLVASSFFSKWTALSGFNIENKLTTTAQVKKDFSIKSGVWNNDPVILDTGGYQKPSSDGLTWEIFTSSGEYFSTSFDGGLNDSNAPTTKHLADRRISSYLGGALQTYEATGASGWWFSGTYFFDIGPEGAGVGNESGTYSGTGPPYKALSGSNYYITGPFVQSPIEGKHSLLMINLPVDAQYNDLYAMRTGISLTSDRDYRITADIKQVFQTGNTSKNLLFTVAGYTGGDPTGNLVYWDPSSSTWTTTLPSHNIAPTDKVQTFSVDFETRNFVNDTIPNGYNILLAIIDDQSTDQTNAKIIAVDNVQIQIAAYQYQYLLLDANSPNDDFYIDAGLLNKPFTIEFDVASVDKTSSDIDGLSGSTSNTLPPLSGVVNHGVYICDGTRWDFIEITPDGIRSYNHPELQLSTSLKVLTRIRIGVRDNDIYILTEDGKGLAGVGKFNTPVPSSIQNFNNKEMGAARVAFGAPLIAESGSFTEGFSFSGDKKGRSAGHTYWKNIKLLTNRMEISPSGLVNRYTTDTISAWTEYHDAGVALDKWLYAEVEFRPNDGGLTVVYPEILTTSGTFEARSGEAIVLSGSSPMRTSLLTLPVDIGLETGVNKDSKDGTGINFYNRIRFRIDQRSYDGLAPAPAVGKITVVGEKNVPVLDMIPDWKPAATSGDIEIYIDSEKYKRTRPEAGSWSTVFIDVNDKDFGQISGSLIDRSFSGYSITINGTGEVVQGKWDKAFRNYTYKVRTSSGDSTIDWQAAIGTGDFTNLIVDPTLDKPFKEIKSGTIEGKLASELQIPPGYDNTIPMILDKIDVISSTQKNAQSIELKTKANSLNCGIEVPIRSGAIDEAQKDAEFSFLLRLNSGKVRVLASGDVVTEDPNGYLIDSSDYSGAFGKVIVPCKTTGTGEAWIRIVSEQNEQSAYIIDDLSFSLVDSSYLSASSIGTYIHEAGVIGQVYIDNGFASGKARPDRAATIASATLTLSEYPTGENYIIKKTRDSDNRGFSLSIESGYPVASFDIVHNAWKVGDINNYSDATSDEYVASYTLTGTKKVPVGRPVNITFIHQTHAHRRHGSKSISGQSIVANIANDNRAFIAIDGEPVAVVDTCPQWISKKSYYVVFSTGTDAAPWNTMVADGDGPFVALSGIRATAEFINVARPIAADLEEVAAMDMSRKAAPYFLPDVYLKPGHILQKEPAAISTSGDPNVAEANSPSIYTQSIYTLDSPDGITNFDHGTNRNHLIFYGDVEWESGQSPYNSGFGSTRFHSGAYGVAKYSSALERFLNRAGNTVLSGPQPTGNFPGLQALYPVYTLFYAGGWVNAKSTGEFFEMCYREDQPDDHGIVIRFKDEYTIEALRRTAGGNYSILVNHKEDSSVLNRWIHVGIKYLGLLSYTGTGQNWSTPGVIFDLYVSGELKDSKVAAGLDVGFKYQGNIEETEPSKSSIFFGRKADVNMVDFFICTNHLLQTETPVLWDLVADPTGDKGGLYQKVFFNGQMISGVAYPDFRKAVVTLPPNESGTLSVLWAGANEYMNDEGDNFDGPSLYPTRLFLDAATYYHRYDDTLLKRAFGDTNSPIRVVFSVPSHAINIASIDSPVHSTDISVSTIDLSDSNPFNISSYLGGVFTLADGETQKGIYTRLTQHGGFELGSTELHTGTLNTYSGNQDIRARRLDSQNPNQVYDGWIVSGDHAYDIIEGCAAGTGVKKTALGGSPAMSGHFAADPLWGKHSIAMQDWGTTVGAIQTDITLYSGQTYVASAFAKRVYPDGTGKAFIAIAGATGDATKAENYVTWYDYTTSTWKNGNPFSAISGQFDVIRDQITPVQFEFTIDGAQNNPTKFGIMVGVSGAAPLNTVPDGQMNFVLFDNINVYDKKYSIAKSNLHGINSGQFSGQFDVTFRGQLTNSDVRVTTMSLAHEDLEIPSEAFFAYLVGRGKWAVSIPETFPHNYGNVGLSGNTTDIERYIENIEKIKNRLLVTDDKGNEIPETEWDIIISPFSPSSLISAIKKGQDIYLDGIGTGSGIYSTTLPDGDFSVLVLLKDIPEDTWWVSYPAANIDNGVKEPSRREIINPVPIMRRESPAEFPYPGMFSTSITYGDDSRYDITIYGMSAEFSGWL